MYVAFTETGYQPRFHKVYTVATDALLNLCLAKNFAEQYFLLTNEIMPRY